jgi:hypothetical protein
VKLTTHLHLVPRSRIRGAISPFFKYAFMAWCSIKAQGLAYLLLTLNSFQKAKGSTKLIIWKYLNGYVKLCVIKSQNCGLKIGISMTMLHLTIRSLSSSF